MAPAVLLASLAIAPGALANSALTPEGCVEDNDAGPGCAQSTDGLDGAREVAVSPDGKSAYVVSRFDDAIVRFDRNATTGAIVPVDCVDDNDTGPEPCAQSTDGLDGAFSVAVSPDNKSVYVASPDDDAIARFDRNTTTGAIVPAGCVDDAFFGDDTCAQSAGSAGDLSNPQSIAVSPDNKSVYAITFSRLVRFDRNTTTGAITFAGCVNDSGCAQNTIGLTGASSVTVSPDNKSVYVAGSLDDAIVRFDRNTTTGAIVPVDCVDDNDTGSEPCAQSTNGLDGASSVAVSLDGKSVYAASMFDSAVVRFDRNTTTGAIVPLDCVDDTQSGDDICAQSNSALGTAGNVFVSPDGKSVYVVAGGDDAIVHFDRNTTTGAITPVGCVNDPVSPAPCQRALGMFGGDSGAVSGDGKSVYAVSDFSNAIVQFGRGRSYPRPKGATPLRVPLVPAYKQCTSPNRTHGPPDLPGGTNPDGSCNPPVQESAQLTVGTPDTPGNNKPVNSVGSVRLAVSVGDPGTPADEADVRFRLSLTDVRKMSDLSDYTGELQAKLTIRLTDRLNGASQTEPGTTLDVVFFRFTVLCAATPGPADIGGSCSTTTTADAVMPGAVRESKRTIWQLGRVEVLDGGADGDVDTTPNTLFATQGIFVP